MVGATLLLGCASSSGTFQEAEALEGQGKLEEAASRFDAVCTRDPEGAACAGADGRSAAARVKAAEKALEEGQYRKGARLLRLALLSADEKAAKDINDRLAKDDVVQGVRYEEATADPDKRRALAAMEAVAASQAPAAEKAKAWRERERPALLVEQVKAACGPRNPGSCAKAWAALEALPQKPAGAEEARGAYEAEQKRVYQARFEAERFLAVFAQRGQKEKELDKCTLRTTGIGFAKEAICRSEVGLPYPHESFDADRNDASLFRKRLAIIGDPDVVASLNARRKEALETGTYTKVDVKKPAGGGK